MSAINFNGGGSGSGSNVNIDDILNQIHKHENKNVIDLFTIEGSTLYFNNEPIINSLGTILASNIIESVDKKFVSASEKTALSGIRDNIQNTLDVLKTSVKFVGAFNTYSLLTSTVKTPQPGNISFILQDENNSNERSAYIYENAKWNLVYTNKGIKASSITQETNLNFVTSAALSILSKLSTDENQKLLWNGKPIDGNITSIKASAVEQEIDLNFVTNAALSILSKLSVDENQKLLWDGQSLTASITAGALIKDDVIAADSVFSSFKVNSLLSAFQPKFAYTPENSANKGIANGYTPLNSLGKVDDKYLPTSSYIANSSTAMNNIVDPENGNMCFVYTKKEFYLYNDGWQFIAKGDSGIAGKNNLTATRNPLNSDDELAGYAPGNIWINASSAKGYICTNADAGNAVWELMAGSKVLNVSEIIPVRLDPTSYILDGDRHKFSITKTNFDPVSDYIELSMNGIELDQNKDYTVEEDTEHTNIYISKPFTDSDAIFGEIYKNSLGTSSEQMMKYDYDSNGNGKVDYAEISDVTKNFVTFVPSNSYSKDQIIIEGNRLLKAKDHFTSGAVINLNDWIVIEAKANDISKFTLDDLIESDTKKFVSPAQITDINKIPSMLTNLNANGTSISSNTAKIATANTNIQDLYNLVNNKTFASLKDTPSDFIANATLKVNSLGTGIEYVTNPLYAIKSITDSTDTTYTSIDRPLFKNMVMSNYDEINNVYEFKLDALSTDLKDMPKTFEHGKILACDANSNKYVLASSEDLTMSKENYTKDILASDWTLTGEVYEININHRLSSEALILSIINSSKKSFKNYEYEIIDNQNVKITAPSQIEGTVVINCSLGVANGYWQNALDLSKLQFVDDTQVRLDRGYSSSHMEQALSMYAKKADYYTKLSTDLLYSKKEFEHSHNNVSILNKFSSNSYNEVLFDGKKLLTSIESSHVVIKKSGVAATLTEMYNALESVMSDTILASELLIKNNGSDILNLVIYDEGYELINIEILPGDIQKYQLGISKNIRFLVKGSYEYKVTISSL